MKRGFLAGGAAILVAAALAVPLWLAADDDGGRRAAALGSAGPGGFSAELAIDGVAGGPFPVERFSWKAKAAQAAGGVVGETKAPVTLGDFELVRPADSKSSAWFGFAAGAQATKTPATLVVKKLDQNGLMHTVLTYRLTDAAVRAYGSSDDDTIQAAMADPPFDTVGLRYSAIEHVLPKGTAVAAAPGGAYLRMTVSTASSTPIEIKRYEFGFLHPLDEHSGLPRAESSVDRLLVKHRLDDGLAPWFAERAKTGATPAGTTVTIELRRADQTGTVKTYMTYELKNAVVENVEDVGVDGGQPWQDVGFAFDTLKATSADGSGCIAASALC